MPTIQDSQTTRKRVLSAKDAENLDQWKLDITDDAETLDDQRDKANQDFRFLYATGGMWEGFLEDEFATRVKLQFDITSPYKNRFIGEWNQNRVGVVFKPDDNATTDKDAKNLSGIYRSDFRQFSGKLSVDNAVDEVTIAGYGCFKMAAQFEDEEDPENDKQRITFRPINTAYNSVIWDNASKWINKMDARRCTELTEYTDSSFRAAFPGFEPSTAYEPESKRWLNYLSGNFDVFYVATRYEVVKKKESVFIYENLETGKMEVYSQEDHEDIKSELRANEFRNFVRERKITRQTVMKSVFSGTDIIERTQRIAGKYIPIIPIYGYRGYVDGVEWYRGLIRGLMDPQRIFNMQISQIAENAASNGQEIPIFDPDQMMGEIKDSWADRNNKPYLLARTLRDDEGKVIASGPTGYLKPGQLDGSVAALMDITTSYVQQATGGVPQETFDPNASGKAIKALLKRENQNTQEILDNISNAIEWSGVVYQEMAKEIYNTRRIVRTIGEDGMEGQVMINEMIMDEETGRMIEANSIDGKKFRAHADVGPLYETEREAKVEELKGMMEALGDTEAGQKYTPAIIASMLVEGEGPGTGPLRKIARRDLILQGLLEPETDEEKAFLEQQQQAAEQPDPQEALVKAAALQAEGEAKERDSKVADNLAAAEKKKAETAQILDEINRPPEPVEKPDEISVEDKQTIFMAELAKIMNDSDSKREKGLTDLKKSMTNRRVSRNSEGKIESIQAG